MLINYMFNMFKSIYSPLNNKRITNSASEIFIKEIENSISTILFDKTYNGKHWEITLMIQMNDTKNAEYVKTLKENAEIKMDGSIKVQLQNDESRNRKNLLTTGMNVDDNYNPIFKDTIDKLTNSKYLDKKYQKIAEQVVPILIKEYTNSNGSKSFNDDELSIYTAYTSNSQQLKYIDKKNFVEFLSVCLQNQRVELKNEIDEGEEYTIASMTKNNFNLNQENPKIESKDENIDGEEYVVISMPSENLNVDQASKDNDTTPHK